MNTYLVQIDATDPQGWRSFDAPDAESAIIQAITPSIVAGNSPQTAYVALGRVRHANGSPIAVQSYRLVLGPSSEANALACPSTPDKGAL